MTTFDYTGADQPVSNAIVDAVAEEASVDPTALPPLYERIDVDAVESIFDSTPNADRRTGNVTFPYYGYCVTVTYDPGETGTIELESLDSSDNPF